MSRPTKRAIMTMAQRLDVQVEIEDAAGGSTMVRLMAPAGHHWANDDIHERVLVGYPSMPALWAEAHRLLTQQPPFDRCSGDTPCGSYHNDGTCEWWGES